MADRTYIPHLGYELPDWMLPYTGKTRIVLVKPSRYMTAREFVEGLGITGTRSFGRNGRPRSNKACWAQRIGILSIIVWKKRGDYERVHLRVGTRPYFTYVPLYPVSVLNDALSDANAKDARTRRIRGALKTRLRQPMARGTPPSAAGP